MFVSQLSIIMFFKMMSHEQLSSVTGISVDRLRDILRDNECSYPEAERILSALDMDLMEFFSFSPSG
ncbi:MAG: helix-turn-helix transcriptional regulator [Deltaproteobacteria bacterium]|nr:helix-turn-helix transcriptional regulator [Deltaproteobacteria bacterium]